MVSSNSMIPADLEKSEVMKMLAEELIKIGSIAKGIDVARQALEIQSAFFHGMVNTNVQETMLLMAEALTIDSQIDEAIKLYTEVLKILPLRDLPKLVGI